MLLSVIKYFRGYVHVKLTGYAPERFLNLCGNRNILIWNLKPCENGYTFCISVDAFRQLKPILKKTKTQIRIQKRVGMPFCAFRYRRRYLFPAGLLFFCFLLYDLSGCIWNIEINGNSYLTTETILDFLEEEHASFGTKKSRISCEDLEEAMRSRYRDVIWTSIKIYGTKMTVDIQENLLPQEEYEAKSDKPQDIVAAKDGVITEMVTRAGTPLAAVGAEVKKGDILVSGRIEVLNDDGEIMQYLYRPSDADIKAKVLYSYRDVIDGTWVEMAPTGNTKECYSITLLDNVFDWPFFRNPFAEYQVQTESRQLHVADNFYLPVWLNKSEFTEVEQVRHERTEEEIRQIATKNLSDYIKDLEEKGIQIISKNVIIKSTGEKYVVSGDLWAHESIVSYQPTEVYDTTMQERQNENESD